MNRTYRAPFGPIQILHDDAHLLVAAKPAGLLSVPGRGPEKTDCMAARMDALTVHRLDMETSGLMVFARTNEAQSRLSRQFADRTVGKRYVAEVSGHPLESEGEVDLPLISDWPNRPRQKICHERGKPSLTRWRVISRSGSTTRLSLTPITGRSHQLRVHLAALGHPILGDSLYAPPDVLARSSRLLLHADRLSFRHPNSETLIWFASSVPF